MWEYFRAPGVQPEAKVALGWQLIDFKLDARVGVGLNHASGPDHFYGIGFARRW